MRQIKSAWGWIPTLYFAQGLPYVAVMTISVVMYKNLGLSNTDIAIYTSWLYLPWVIKPIWSPLIEIFKTKRWWIVIMQLLIGASFSGIAFSLQAAGWVQLSLCIFWLMAFSSATHDIASDGFYMIGLNEYQQSWFSGIKNTFYRLAMLSGQGLFLLFVSWIDKINPGNPTTGWKYLFLMLALLFIILSTYHNFILPKEDSYQTKDKNIEKTLSSIIKEFMATFIVFFQKKNIKSTLIFLLTFRFAEAQLVKMASPFLLDLNEQGGMGLTVGDVGFIYGTIGIIALTIGGITGGMVIAAKGLKYWLWPMSMAITLPNLAYVFLAYNINADYLSINIAVAIEQFGYGFGFTGYMMYMIYSANGTHKTSHYAICTAFMALGMMIPGLFSGMMQEWLGYKNFFIWIMISCLPVYLGTSLISIESDFGKKRE